MGFTRILHRVHRSKCHSVVCDCVSEGEHPVRGQNTPFLRPSFVLHRHALSRGGPGASFSSCAPRLKPPEVSMHRSGAPSRDGERQEEGLLFCEMGEWTAECQPDTLVDGRRDCPQRTSANKADTMKVQLWTLIPVWCSFYNACV